MPLYGVRNLAGIGISSLERGTYDWSLYLSLFILLAVLAPRKLCLSYVEPRSGKDLGESLRESLLGDLLGK
jgi:hypothetical protein